MSNVACSKCGALIQPYWLKDGVCNGCRNPHLIVKAILNGDAAPLVLPPRDGTPASMREAIERAMPQGTEAVLAAVRDQCAQHFTWGFAQAFDDSLELDHLQALFERIFPPKG